MSNKLADEIDFFLFRIDERWILTKFFVCFIKIVSHVSPIFNFLVELINFSGY